jgi:hypothetical protein
MNRNPEFQLSRREFLRLSMAGVLTAASVPWFESIARAAVQRPRGKSCILLWMDGGPSQQHTFDPKPGGEFKSIATSVPGIHIVEQLPKLARCMDDLALIRSMSTEIKDHYDAKYHLHTGFKRVTGFEHPALGCIASSQLGRVDDDLPAFVTIDAGSDKVNGGRFYRSVPAYLGPEHAPLAVQNPAQGLENLRHPADGLTERLALLERGEAEFASGARRVRGPSTLRRSRTGCATPTGGIVSVNRVCSRGGWWKRACRSSRFSIAAGMITRARRAASWPARRGWTRACPC